MTEAKHSFVDDYPYLVYSPNVNATASSNGETSMLFVANYDLETEHFDKTYSEIKNAMQTQPVILTADYTSQNGPITYYFPSQFWDAHSSYDGKAVIFALCMGQSGPAQVDVIADTVDSYPILD